MTQIIKKKRNLILILIIILTIILMRVLSTWNVKEFSGIVVDETGNPIPDAVIRIKTTTYSTTSGSDGRFSLIGFPPALKIRVTAWAEEYYINGSTVWPWDSDISITLSSYIMEDNEAYQWGLPSIEDRPILQTISNHLIMDPFALLGADSLFFHYAEELELGCYDCHGDLVYEQWANSAHSLGFSNTLFSTMYLGTDIYGNQSPETRYMTRQDYAGVPLRPDPKEEYYGPGYKLDFPDSDGNCAACHLPAAALNDPLGTDPSTVMGVNALGTHCDFCHKIQDVRFDHLSGLPYENMPGVLSMEILRPQPQSQIFFGPYDDVDAGTDTYLALQNESLYCAPCHQASFWGVPVYESFGEWLASPYSDPESGQTCQDCHMKPDGITTNFAPGRGGKERDPQTIFSHKFPGASDIELLQNTAELTVEVIQNNGTAEVNIIVTNSKAGHHIPTDSPLRQIFLLVTAVDDFGKPLELINGDLLPDWAGDLAGKAGRYYAKILKQLWTEESPTGAYWTQTRILEDTRIAAFGKDISTFTFELPDTAGFTIDVELIYRRVFYDLAQQKGWDIPDIQMLNKVFSFPNDYQE